MRRVFNVLTLVLLTAQVLAQPPEKMSYQAIIRNNSNQLVTNQTIRIKISILLGSPLGAVVYTETQTPSTNDNGLVTIEIGGGAGFIDINWANGPYFIQTETDPTGGTNYTITGTSQLLSVPYAMYAKKAGNVFSGYYDDLLNKPILFDGTWLNLTGKPSFSTLALSGDYNDLLNKPTIFSGNYNDLLNKPVLFSGAWLDITGKPTTISGYGITDGMSTTHPSYEISSNMISNWNTAFGWGDHTGLYKTSSYVPAWSEIADKPTFEVVATTGSYSDLLNKPALFDGTWASLTDKPTFAAISTSGTFADLLSKPTTLEGYGITDGMSIFHPANNITTDSINSWNTAFSWGNHIGLYRPVSYVPSWNEISMKPSTVEGYGITDAVTTTGDQTISGNKAFTGIINASDNPVTNVANPVNLQDAATKEYVDNIFKALGLVHENFTGTVTDIDGNAYKTVKIGNQTWMAENLKTTRYNNADLISTESSFPSTNEEEGFQWAYDNNENNVSTYGRLYNYYAAIDSRGICPSGWRLPNDDEWITLTEYLGGSNVAGGKLKEDGTEHWLTPNTGATNESGFTALPGGSRDYLGSYSNITTHGSWWSSSNLEGGSSGMSQQASFHQLIYDNASKYSYVGQKVDAYSVRCLKDMPLPSLNNSDAYNISQHTATFDCNITDDGGVPVLERGISWNECFPYCLNPSIYVNKTSDGAGTGSFTSELINLLPDMRYVVYAYATTINGTAYGNKVYFTTLPIVTTTSISDITTNTAKSGGEISDLGFDAQVIIARGVCWSTSENPTIADNKTADGSGYGEFTSLITDLLPDKTYFVRAYVTTNFGTAYGENVTFTTLP